MTAEHPLLGGTDGFRAEATMTTGPGQMNPETIAGMTTALIDYQHEQGIDGPVVIAADTRPSGPELREAALGATRARGVRTIDLDVAPTPTAQKVADWMGAMATVVITASHNPEQDNGWKGMLGSRKPNSREVQAISDGYWQQTESGLSVPVTSAHQEIGRLDLMREYRDAVVENVEETFGRQPLRGTLFVIDGANGAGQYQTPQVFRRLGARVETFGCDKDGHINKNCGAADLSGLKQFLEQRPDIMRDPAFVGALANDGDADRVMGIGVNKNGKLVEITGNHLMHALALHPKQPGIVGTEYTNSAVTDSLRGRNVDFEYCPNGDVHVTNGLRNKQSEGQSWVRGGEFTGHLIDTSWLGSGDGVRTAAWFAAWAVQRQRTFGELHAELPLWPEVMTKISLPKGSRLDVASSSVIQTAIERAQTDGVRPIVRASGTEPLIRIWNEAPDPGLARAANLALRASVEAAMEAA